MIINNACQTIRRPPAYYSHLMAIERGTAADDTPAVRRQHMRHGCWICCNVFFFGPLLPRVLLLFALLAVVHRLSPAPCAPQAAVDGVTKGRASAGSDAVAG